MPRTRSVEVVRREPRDLDEKIVRAIARVGPRNVAEIARITDAHPESVRYKIRRRLGRLGFRFQADVDFAKLGLSLNWATLRFTNETLDSAPTILRALNKSAYLVHYTRLIPQGYHLALFSLPNGKETEYSEFLERLRVRGVLSDFELKQALISRHKPMDPTLFNFQSGRWEIDWRKVRETKGTPIELPKRSATPAVDYYDMLIIKELQIDALQHLVDIARKMKTNEKTMEYHHRNHVIGEKLVAGYRTRWMQDTKKNLAHSFAFTRLTFRELQGSDLSMVQDVMSKIPFLWAEDLLKGGTYIATLGVPLAETIPLNVYLSDELGELASNMESGILKPSESGNFTIPYNMYINDRWEFDIQQMEEKVLSDEHQFKK